MNPTDPARLREGIEKARQALGWLAERMPRHVGRRIGRDQVLEVEAALSNAEALARAHLQLLEAVREARRELWWFVERDTGEGWGFDESDVDLICEKAMRIQDEILYPALAAGFATEGGRFVDGGSATYAMTDDGFVEIERRDPGSATETEQE